MCGLRSPTLSGPRVINGQNAAEGDWPWQVLVSGPATTCAGTLISDSHVITAAHCFAYDDVTNIIKTFCCISCESLFCSNSNNPLDYLLQLGSIYRSEPDINRETATIRTITLHPDYQTFYYGNDLALLTLDLPVTFTNYVRPICLHHIDDVVPLSSTCYSTGWGLTQYERINNIK